MSPRSSPSSTYRYLGIVVNQQLDYAAMAKARAEAARKVFGMMQHTLRDRRLPVHERITLAKAFVVPVALFGAELWAGRVAGAGSGGCGGCGGTCSGSARRGCCGRSSRCRGGGQQHPPVPAPAPSPFPPLYLPSPS